VSNRVMEGQDRKSFILQLLGMCAREKILETLALGSALTREELIFTVKLTGSAYGVTVEEVTEALDTPPTEWLGLDKKSISDTSEKLETSEEHLEALFVQVQEFIFNLPGMDINYQSNAMIECTHQQKIYIKFMSDRGKTDAPNGFVLQAWLTQNGIAFEAERPRSMHIIDAEKFLQMADLSARDIELFLRLV